MTEWIKYFLYTIFLLAATPCSGAQPDPPKAAEQFVAATGGDRHLVFISDTHLGIGRQPDGTWYATEDFRWPNALRGFLDYISSSLQDQIDLVIVGDFLELWQPPPGFVCHSLTSDLGCTLDDMEVMTQAVVAAHEHEFAALRSFSRRQENRIHVIPGNHDSTLLYAQIWRHVGQALGSESGRINIVISGTWTSPDGVIVAEHGHQIGADVNGYKTWPDIVETVNGTNYVIRSWGEQFVQGLFNEEETTYPIIDNLSPETAGARYRMADRGLWKSAADVARFLAFNLFETSLSQKSASLGADASGKPLPPSVERARELGHELFLAALPDNDPFRSSMANDSAEAARLRVELDSATKTLPVENILLLCDQAALLHGPVCTEPTLGALVQASLVPRARVIRAHLAQRRLATPRMRFFIYGHTHQYEKPWEIDLDGLTTVGVTNTGAFQRLINETGYLKRIKAMHITEREGLRQLPLDKLPACYTFVTIDYESSIPKPKLLAWHQEEDGQGRVVDPEEDNRCQ
jgi:hypothetical protein